jgi:amidase
MGDRVVKRRTGASVDAAELMFGGVARQVALVAAGEVTSVQLTTAALERIERSQATLGAFRLVFDDALERAAAADRMWAAGERLALLGVPVAVKDDTDVAGETTPFGVGGAFRPKREDSEVVRRLRAAGAVIVGKTKTSELGQWPTGDTVAFGLTRNPWDLGRTPGGSSAGSAAAVAAGLVAGAVGSDGAGSVRIPAAWSGLVGLKPQRGRISSWPDPDPFQGITCHGPLARTVGDVAVLLDAITGNHPGDRFRPPAPAEPFSDLARRDPGRLRVAVSFRVQFFIDTEVDSEIRAAVERIARVLADLGHDVFAADPDYGFVGASFLPRGMAGSVEWYERMSDAHVERATRTEIRLGRLLSGWPLRIARGVEPYYQRKIGRIFDRADVVLTPTTAHHPLPAGALEGLGWWASGALASQACPFCWVWNTLGWPGLNVPAGLSAAGLPIGAQLLGRPYDEVTLLRLGAHLEAAERWADRRPPEVGTVPPGGARISGER